MNYRHHFHAGNFADVHKHAVLALAMMRLREKPTPFRVIDTHAGAGVYDLTGEQSARTGEWRDGIGRLYRQPLGADLAALLSPYLEAVAKFNGDGPLATYPGSPALVRAFLRREDRLVACELEPSAAADLAATLTRDPRAKAVAIDGWTALKAYLPPKERRGFVLVDPPYEQPDEFARLGERIIAAARKWPSGIYMLWYPIKGGDGPQRLARMLAGAGIPRIVRSELLIEAAGDTQRLRGSGLILVNPPWQLPEQMALLTPALAGMLGHAGEGASRYDWLAREK
jgi:23S rRNA (adenine2030-N6)-methyltransferase